MKLDVIKDFYKIFDEYDISSVGEIGTHSGKSASQILNYLLAKNKTITYKGYDLFNEANDTTNKDEVNGKGIGNYERSLSKLWKLKKRYRDLFEFELIKGNTRDTLTSTKFDFVYIDGGHSYETVKHDYEMVKDSKIIVFDDYQISGVKEAVDEIIKLNPGLYEVTKRDYATNPAFPRTQVTFINTRT